MLSSFSLSLISSPYHLRLRITRGFRSALLASQNTPVNHCQLYRAVCLQEAQTSSLILDTPVLLALAGKSWDHILQQAKTDFFQLIQSKP
jgi:hypothetical protein